MIKHYAELYDDREEGKVMERVACPSHDLAWEKAQSMLSDWTDCDDGSKPSHIHVRVRDVEVKYVVKAYDDRDPERILHKIEASTYDKIRWEEKRYLDSFADPDDHVRPLHLCTDIEEVEV